MNGTNNHNNIGNDNNDDKSDSDLIVAILQAAMTTTIRGGFGAALQVISSLPKVSALDTNLGMYGTYLQKQSMHFWSLTAKYGYQNFGANQDFLHGPRLHLLLSSRVGGAGTY